jgi:hypothetical protein
MAPAVQKMTDTIGSLTTSIEAILLPIGEFLQIIKVLENTGKFFLNSYQLIADGFIFLAEGVWGGLISAGEAIADFGVAAHNLATDGIIYTFNLGKLGLLGLDSLLGQFGIDITYIFSNNLFSLDTLKSLASFNPFKVYDLGLLGMSSLISLTGYDINLAEVGFLNPHKLFLNGSLTLNDIGGIGMLIGQGIMNIDTCIMNGMISPASAIMNNYLNPVKGFNQFGEMISIDDWDNILEARLVNPVQLINLFNSIGISTKALLNDLGITDVDFANKFTSAGQYVVNGKIFTNPINLINIDDIIKIDVSAEKIASDIGNGLIDFGEEFGEFFDNIFGGIF